MTRHDHITQGRAHRLHYLALILNHRKNPNADSNEGNNDEEQVDTWIAAGD
jgi:hypothetical protein